MFTSVSGHNHRILSEPISLIELSQLLHLNALSSPSRSIEPAIITQMSSNYLSLYLYLYPFAVPPNIDDSTTSSDVIVREGANVTLRCRATGSPSPAIKWRRDDNSKISIGKNLNGKWEQESALPPGTESKGANHGISLFPSISIGSARVGR